MMRDIDYVESADMPEQITRYGRKGYDFNFDIVFDNEKGCYTYKSKRFDSYEELRIWQVEQKIDAVASLLL